MAKGRGTTAWLVVVLIGLLVLAVVFGLRLFPRLDAGQRVLDAARPAFKAERVAGDRAGIAMVSKIVDLADPVTTPAGGASAEIPRLVSFIAGRTGLTRPAVLTALRKSFPRTAALLGAIQLSSVADELPGLTRFLARTLRTSRRHALDLLARRFPHLTQSITALPLVTAGWEAVPGTAGLTRFSGAPARTMPRVRDYLAGDLIPVLERRRADFRQLDGLPGGAHLIPPLLTVIGAVVVLFGLLMAVRGGGGPAAWGVVVLVGVVVVGVVLGFKLFPRLKAGQRLVDDARPAFTAQRVAGARAGVAMVSHIVDLADPLVTRRGGAAGEVPRLVAFVSARSGMSQAAVGAALAGGFPHTDRLLSTLPLSSVSGELPRLVRFLSTTLKVSEARATAALRTTFPRLAQSIAALPRVTAGWESVPGTRDLTRFDGTPVRSVPDVRNYFALDVIPVLVRERADFHRLQSTWPSLTVFPPLLLGVGAVVILYGLLMLGVSARRR